MLEDGNININALSPRQVHEYFLNHWQKCSGMLSVVYVCFDARVCQNVVFLFVKKSCYINFEYHYYKVIYCCMKKSFKETMVCLFLLHTFRISSLYFRNLPLCCVFVKPCCLVRAPRSPQVLKEPLFVWVAPNTPAGNLILILKDVNSICDI